MPKRKQYYQLLDRLDKKGHYLGEKTSDDLASWRRGFRVNYLFECPSEYELDFMEPDYDPLRFFANEDRDRTSALELKSGSDITSEDWLPESVVLHTPTFWHWINSINGWQRTEPKGYKHRKKYKPFELYVQQANDWMADTVSINDFNDFEDREIYINREFNRCRENTLYAVMKYGYMNDSTTETGSRKYRLTDKYEHQAILVYLLDCGYSLSLGKPRQIGATTIYGLAIIFFILLHRNFFVKFITKDVDKGVEIVNDKFKSVYSYLPEWFKTKVGSDAQKKFQIGRKKDKGEYGIPNSRIEVDAPTKTAINGGSPNIVLIDEQGDIDILVEMKNEAYPTLLVKDPDTGELRQSRQVIGWGTGVPDNKTSVVYENEWKRIKGLWQERAFDSLIEVPVFFDWTTRLEPEDYEKKKKYYYGIRAKEEGVSMEASRIQFHQHYPTTDQDMFITAERRLMSRDWIETNIVRIRTDKDELLKEMYGWFVPTFGEKEISHGIIPAEYETDKLVIKSSFEQLDIDDARVSTIMLIPNDNTIENRWYAGVDPIAHDTGYSNMATTIMDAKTMAPACLVDFRKENSHKFTWFQHILALKYYGSPCTLVERTQGEGFTDYCDLNDVSKEFLYTTELTEPFREKRPSRGIDKKGNRSDHIIGRLQEYLQNYGTRIWILTYFSQLLNFVQRNTSSGGTKYETKDRRYFNDDALDSLVYAYIAYLSKVHYRPMKEVFRNEDLNDPSTYDVKYRMAYDKDYNLVQQAYSDNPRINKYLKRHGQR